MFWKNADSAAAGRTRSPWLWSSITGRLVVLYTLSASLILIAATVILYWLMARNLNLLATQFLAEEVHDLRTIVQERPDDAQALAAEVNYQGAGAQFPDYFAQILDQDGRIVAQTPHMESAIPANSYPRAASVGEPVYKVRTWTSRTGRSYVLAAAWATFGNSTDTRRLIRIALDVTQEKAVVANFRRQSVSVILFGICVAAGAGVVVARLGMRPLQQITLAAQRTGPARLHDRVTPGHWPTELSALASEFDAMLDRLEDSFTRLSQFSADLAHELRTPLNNLMGEVEVALARPRSPAEYQRILESNLEEHRRLARLIENLLFLARAESPQTQITRSAMDARAEIAAICEFHEAVAQERGIQVQCAGHELLEADPLLFRQAVSNLLSNALQHTPRGGQVTITVKRVDPQFVEVSVQDTGCGIAPEHLNRIFDRFYRTDPARSQSPAGCGLGLAIVKSIMALHGGTVTVASTPAHGTTLTLCFPSPPPTR